ncbi:UNVERIFIED_ORG: IclR family KDG regulon transcriptional repressor [Heyndrickxia coagulans]
MLAISKEKVNVLASVRNSILILKSFSENRPAWKVTDLAKSLGLAKSTVSRLVTTLASEGLLKKNPKTGEYHLGLGVLALSGVLMQHLEIHKQAAPILSQLAAATKEATHLAILDGFDTVYIDKEESLYEVKMKTFLGRRNPTHAVSSGKVLLAFSDQAFIEAYIKNGLQAFASRTIMDPTTLKKTLERIRKDGYATSYAEMSESIASVAAPVRDYKGKVVAAITVVGKENRFNTSRMNHLIRLVKEASDEISERMGYDKRFFRNV